MWAYYTEKDQLRTYQSGVFKGLEDIVPQIKLITGLCENLPDVHLALNLTTMSWYHYEFTVSKSGCLDSAEWSWIGDSVFQQK